MVRIVRFIFTLEDYLMKFWGLSFIALLSMSAANAAMVLPNLTYILGDHPDANLQSLPDVSYGLRIDSIANMGSGGNGSDAAKTFSTTQETASVSLFWDDMNDSDDTNDVVTIMGQVSRNSNDSIWDVIYTLTDITAVADGFVAGAGTGTLSDGTDSFDLTGETNNQNYVFLGLGDGHRLSNDGTSEVGRGWLEPNGSTDDWLVTLTPVPVPAALPLLLSGLLGFSVFGRRKSA